MRKPTNTHFQVSQTAPLTGQCLSFLSCPPAEYMKHPTRVCVFSSNRLLLAMQAVDLLLAKWNTAWHKLMAAEQKYEKSGKMQRPQGRTVCCGCSGERHRALSY